MVPGADEDEDEDVVIIAGGEDGGAEPQGRDGTEIDTLAEEHKATAPLRAALDRLDVTLL